MRSDGVYLSHVLDCIAAIQSHTAGGHRQFIEDRKTQKAVLRELHELAESTQRLSPDLKARFPEIPWPSIAGLRNVIVHDYLGLTLERIWAVVQNDLAPLEAVAKRAQQEFASLK
ncbi:MAG: DUF86 domain-containing protein [Proteobacteria bacterium]|nr:DUF86 domain-containing protein [Pseudomonadota bacterium]